jgi:hypothetical protein
LPTLYQNNKAMGKDKYCPPEIDIHDIEMESCLAASNEDLVERDPFEM